MVATFVANDKTAPVTLANRLGLEAGGTITLGAGTYYVDQAARFISGLTLIGAGMDRTFIRQTGMNGVPYPFNCSATAIGDGIGYVDTIAPTGASCTFADPTQLANYHVNEPVYFFTYDGYLSGSQNCVRRIVTAKTASGLSVSGGAIPGACTAAKWLRSYPIADCREGDVLRGLPRNRPIIVSEGPSQANEMRSEYLGQPAGAVRRSYRSPVIVTPTVVRNVSISDLTFGEPEGVPSAGPVFFKYCYDWRLTRVKANGPLGFASSAGIIADSCVSNYTPASDGFGLNNCHNVTVIGGRWSSIVMEECCFDIEIRGGLIGPTSVTGIRMSPPYSDRVRVFGTAFTGCDTTFALAGRECMLADLIISGASGAIGYLSGDGCSMRNVISDGALAIKAGVEIRLADLRASTVYLGWSDHQDAQGVASNIGSYQILYGQWTVN